MRKVRPMNSNICYRYTPIDITYHKTYHCVMNILTASEARSNLYRLIDDSAASHQPVIIKGKRNTAVLVSAEDWASIQETLFLTSIPGMRESILEGLNTPVGDCKTELDW